MGEIPQKSPTFHGGIEKNGKYRWKVGAKRRKAPTSGGGETKKYRNTMADNYLEKKFEEMEARRASRSAKEQRKRQAAYKKRMEAYRKKLEEQKKTETY